jgi:CRISPR-associated endonuclease Csn1
MQELNNLRYIIDKEEYALNDQQRTLALSLLAGKDKVTFDQLRKKLGFIDSVHFNLERGSRPGLKGMTIDVAMARAVGKEWHGRDEHEKTTIVRLLLNDDLDEYHKTKRLVEKHGMSVGQAEKALAVTLPTGYMSVSRKAIEKLLPHMECGLVLQSATDPEVSALHAAGYFRRDELQRRLFDQLPDLSRVKASDCKIGDIPNPVVKRALVELRKVVNAIIREYGKPDAVHVEMARNVQVGAETRKEINKKMRDREKLRSDAADEVRKAGVAVTRDSVLRQLLWWQQSSNCLYCGKAISQSQLFGGAVDIDHIFPRHRSLDDSQMNKVVAHRECNSEKGQRTPYEWLAGSQPARYDVVTQLADSQMRKGLLPYPKYKRFLQKELDTENFVARQLVDTGYITRATVEYLQLLFDKPHNVLGLRGQLTAELRWQWGLDTILSELPDSPAWQEQAKLRDGEKNRADHRHHAIDALVVALTNRKRLHHLTKLYQAGGARQHGEILPEPWDNFRDSIVAAVGKINVSHRVQRKVSGALHEETYYGKGDRDNEWVVRKPIDALSANEFERIRDAGIRRLVLARLVEHNIEIGRGKKIDPNKLKAALAGLAMPSGVPIKRVRVTKAEQTIRPLRQSMRDNAYVKPGSTHHLCIFEFTEAGNTKREAVFVTMLEATQRIQRKQPIISRVHPERPDATFVMSLSSRELVLANWKGEPRVLSFKTAASTQGQIYFADQYDARRSGDQTKFVATANSLDARKITIDTLGRIRWAND